MPERPGGGLRPEGGAIRFPSGGVSSPSSIEARASQLVAEVLDTEAQNPEVRVSQLPAEVLDSETVNPVVHVSQLVVEVLVRTTPAQPVFVDGTITHPLTWQNIVTNDNVLRAYAEVDLNDEPTYYGGYKAPWVLNWSKITRGLSDRNGALEHMSFGCTLSDSAGRFFRGLLADSTNKYLTNRPLAEWMIDDEDRRLQKPARLVANGYVVDYSPLPGLKFRNSGTDWLKKKFSRSRKAQFAWQPLITKTDFPSAPTTSLNLGAPIIYGLVADDVSTTGSGAVQIPITNGVPGGYYPYSLGLNDPEMGGDSGSLIDAAHRSFGVLPGTVPTSPTLAGAAGGSLPKTRNDSWTIMVTAIHGVVESDPSPTKQVNLNWDGGDKSLSIGWTAASGGATGGYNIYVTDNPTGAITKMSTYAAPFMVSSDYVWVFHVASGVTTLTVTAPGTNYSVENVFLYTVSALLGGGLESQPSGIILGMSHPYARPLHIRWLPFAAATGYRIRRAKYPGITGSTPNAPTWDVQFDVSSTGTTGAQTIDGVTQYEMFDDFTSAPPGTTPTVGTQPPPPGGVVKPINVGQMTIGSVNATWFLVARHACKTIRSVYLKAALVDTARYGVDVFVPGGAGYPVGTKYVEINNTWYSLIGLTGAAAAAAVDGSAPLTCNVEGIEATGDGTGALITSIAQQAKHFCINYLAPDTPTAKYWLGSSPTFNNQIVNNVALVDDTTFDTVDGVMVARLAGGYVGAGVIGANGTAVDAEQALTAFCQSGDFEFGFSRMGQLLVSMEPPAAPSNPPRLDDVINIVDNTLSITDQVTMQFFNIIPYKHTEDYSGRVQGGWFSVMLGETEVADTTSKTNYDQEIASGTLELKMLRNSTTQMQSTITDVLTRRVRRYANPFRLVQYTVPLSGTSLELGDIGQISSFEGVSATGWTNRNLRTLRHELDPNVNTTTLTAYDYDQRLAADTDTVVFR